MSVILGAALVDDQLDAALRDLVLTPSSSGVSCAVMTSTSSASSKTALQCSSLRPGCRVSLLSRLSALNDSSPSLAHWVRPAGRVGCFRPGPFLARAGPMLPRWGRRRLSCLGHASWVIQRVDSSGRPHDHFLRDAESGLSGCLLGAASVLLVGAWARAFAAASDGQSGLAVAEHRPRCSPRAPAPIDTTESVALNDPTSGPGGADGVRSTIRHFRADNGLEFSR